jgi:hypothetical protein
MDDSYAMMIVNELRQIASALQQIKRTLEDVKSEIRRK